MAAPAPSAVASDDDMPLNEVHLRGRVSGLPETRALPSGDTVVLVRLVVPRLARSRPAAREGKGKAPGVDTLDCAVWRGDLRRRVTSWADGDRVEVVGALHRRFWRSGAGVASRYEVEALSVRRLSRAA
jgi:single-strand DNA-binding protein